MACGLAALALLVGCGGGASERASPPRQIVHDDFRVSVPAAWAIDDHPRQTVASPKRGGVLLLKVASFPLVRPYRPALWPAAVAELDRAAGQLAAKLDGEVQSRRTVVISGRRARQYDIGYARPGRPLVQRTAFVLRGTREYQLTCRFRRSEAAESAGACALLFRTFRLT